MCLATLCGRACAGMCAHLSHNVNTCPLDTLSLHTVWCDIMPTQRFTDLRFLRLLEKRPPRPAFQLSQCETFLAYACKLSECYSQAMESLSYIPSSFKLRKTSLPVVYPIELTQDSIRWRVWPVRYQNPELQALLQLQNVTGAFPMKFLADLSHKPSLRRTT